MPRGAAHTRSRVTGPAGAARSILWRRAATLVLALGVGCLLTGGADGRGPPSKFHITFLVHVLGVQDNGSVKPLRGATVSARPGWSAQTSATGYAVVGASESITAGEYVGIVAEADEYKPERVRILVDQNTWAQAQGQQSAAGRLIGWLLGHKRPVITMTLQQEDDAGPEVELVVDVHDDDGPVQGASVTLHRTSPPIGPVASAYTSKNGEAIFLVPRELIEDGLQARVFAGHHGKKYSDIPTSVLRGGGKRRFLVLLSGGTSAEFSLIPALTQVTNTHDKELTIDAAGHSAHVDNSKLPGAHWKMEYTWKIPSILTPGKNATVTICDTISDVQPDQPLRDYMNFRAPDIAKQLVVDYPSPGHGCLNSTFPIAAGYKTAKELTITIEFLSSGVVYHYRKT